jgi:hypothetical protein
VTTTVTHDDWTFSTSSLCRLFSSRSVIDQDDGLYTISCRSRRTGEPHPTLDGHKVDSQDAATTLGLAVGVLRVWVR